jgi:hypothetical protein
MIRFIFILLLLSSCSAQWHLRTAVKKDKNILNLQRYKTTVIVRDTIKDTIYLPANNFDFSIDSIQQFYAKQNDSLVNVYNDSLVSIYMSYDTLLKKFKLKGKVKERRIPYEVLVHDTIPVEVPCPNPILGLTKWEEIQIWTGRILGLLFLILLIVWRLLKK